MKNTQQTRRPNQNPRNRRAFDPRQKLQPSACRAVSIVLTRNKGVPISAAFSSGGAHRIASEEALLGFGITGLRSGGDPYGRVGIYNFEAGIPVFKFAVNFNMEDGSPIYRPEQAKRATVSESEMSLVNWAQAALFNRDLEGGEYYLRYDAVNSADQPVEGEMVARLGELPLRRQFASERRLEASFEMFDKYLERLEGSPADRFRRPNVTPMIILDQVSPQYIRDNAPTIPMGVADLHPDEYRAFAVARFSEGLRVPTGNHREIRATFIRSFETLDKMRGVARPAMLSATLDRSIESLRVSAMKHIESLDPKRVRLPEQTSSINMALSALRAYVDWRNPDGTVRLLTPPRIADYEDDAEKKQLAKVALGYFERPMFNVVHAAPVQIVTDFQSAGDFPYNGFELYGRA